MGGGSNKHGGVLVIVGTRPEAIKLAPLIVALRQRAVLPVTVCATGQHRELLDGALADFGLVADIDLDLMQPGQRPEAIVAAALPALTAVIDAARPAAIVVQGDTASAYAGAQAGAYAQVPVVHVEAGLRSGSPAEPFPEELHRRLIAQLATLHFAPTVAARAALRREGIADAAIEIVGNTGIDALRVTAARLADTPALHGWATAQLPPLDPTLALLVATAHRRENHGPRLLADAAALQRLAATGGIEIVVPVHPHPAVRAAFDPLTDVRGIHLTPPLSYLSFVALLQRARLVLTDSGGVQEEAPALGCPVLVLRSSTERREGITAGAAQLVGTSANAIVAAVRRVLDDAGHYAAMATPCLPYGDGYAAGRIAAILERCFASADVRTEIAQPV